MFTKSIKTLLAVAVVATGGALSTSVANAGGGFGFYFGTGHRQAPTIYYNHGYNPGYYVPAPRHRVCNPRRALNNAYRMGVYNPHITRVNDRKIVVKGYSHGHRAKVVFKHHSKHCRVLKTRGIY